ncbi:MAG: preprotein translocase subunit YajC [Nocardioides sp.]
MPELASTLLPLLALFGVFWLLIIRPQSKRNKAMAELHAALAEGDRVITTSGILGTVRGLDGDKVSLEVSSRRGDHGRTRRYRGQGAGPR